MKHLNRFKRSDLRNSLIEINRQNKIKEIEQKIKQTFVKTIEPLDKKPIM
jgi:hypothetical protein